MATTDAQDIADLEDVSAMALTAEQLAALVGEGGLYMFSWTTAEGYPVGVLVSYVFRDGRFWTTAPSRRKRVSALRARPASSIVVTCNATTATFKGDSIIHSPSRRSRLARAQGLVLCGHVGHGSQSR